MIILLTSFEFTLEKSAGVVAITAMVFVAFSMGIFSTAGYACFYRLHHGRFEIKLDRLHFSMTNALGSVPYVKLEFESQRSEKSE